MILAWAALLLAAGAAFAAETGGEAGGGFQDDLARLASRASSCGNVLKCEKLCDDDRGRAAACAPRGVQQAPGECRARLDVIRDRDRWYPVFALNEQANRDAPTAGFVLPAFVPYIDQHEPRDAPLGYDGHMHCGKTTMSMIARAFGKKTELTDAELISFFGAQAHSPPQHGFTLRAWAPMTRAVGLAYEMRGPGADLEWITKRLRAGKLVAVLGTFAAMPHNGRPGSAARAARSKTGHYIAVIGADDSGRFLVNDPADPFAKELTASELALFINAKPDRRARGTCPDGERTCSGFQVAIGPAGGAPLTESDAEPPADEEGD